MTRVVIQIDINHDQENEDINEVLRGYFASHGSNRKVIGFELLESESEEKPKSRKNQKSKEE